VWDPDEIIVQVEPRAKMIFILAILLPAGLILLEYAASRPFEIYTRGEMQKEKLWCRVGVDAPGIEVCSSSKDQLHIVGIRTDSLSDILIVKYILIDDTRYHRNYSEYQNITELTFQSYWRFRVQVNPLVDGYVYFTTTSIKIETTNNTKEWHNSYCFYLLFAITLVTELKSLHIIKDIKFN
jgi:hypothetical protein